MEWKTKCQTANQKTMENDEDKMRQAYDNADTDELLEAWCEASDMGLMQAIKAKPSELKALTGRGHAHFFSKAAKILASRPDEAMDGMDHTPHRANKALKQARRLKWIHASTTSADKQQKPIQLGQIWHIIRIIEAPNNQDHCYLNWDQIDTTKRLPNDTQLVDQTILRAIDFATKRYKAPRQKSGKERQQTHEDKLNTPHADLYAYASLRGKESAAIALVNHDTKGLTAEPRDVDEHLSKA